jgi:ferrous iron transport protein A
MTLADIKTGQKAVIKQLSDNSSLRAKLIDLGLLPGTELTLTRSLNWSRAVQIYVRQTHLILRDSMAKQVIVDLI